MSCVVRVEPPLTMSSRTGNAYRKGPILTYRQRQLARQIAQANRHAINTDVDAFLDRIDAEAVLLSKKHRRSVAWFRHQFYQGGRVMRQKRAVSVFNAARQVDAFLEGRKGGTSYAQQSLSVGCEAHSITDITDEEKLKFTEIKEKIKRLNGVENACQLPADMQMLLKTKAEAWRKHKRMSAHGSTRAVVQDARLTLQRVADEVSANHCIFL
jgi:hypothetical protein